MLSLVSGVFIVFQNYTKVLTVKVSKKLIQIIDYFVYELGLWSSRSEFIREAIRLLIQKTLENNKKLFEESAGGKPVKKVLHEILATL